jgi:hypothetical protein
MDLLVRVIVLAAVAVSLVVAGVIVARTFLKCPLCGRVRKDGPLPDFACGLVSIRKNQNRQWAATLPAHGTVLFFSKESALEYAIRELDFEVITQNRAEAARHS